ncbi:MAG: YwaF family protein [Oscillospiraceae bacterium]|nr:YwaF family protein [Oscillospiraceae bacterium]
MIEFIKSTAWPMERQPLFGSFHLIFLAVGLTAAFLCAFFLRKITDRQNRALLLTVGLFLLTTEIYKQLFWFYAITYEHYPFIIFPFHLCSVPMYLCILAAFLPEGKFRQAIYDFLASFCFVGGIISLAVDGGLLREYWTMTLHCLIWHLILVFIGLHFGMSGRTGGKFGFLRACAVFYTLAAAAFCINILMMDVSRGTIDMFFVGPAPMNVVVFSDIAKVTGRPIVSLIYLASITFAAWVSYLALTARKNGRGSRTKSLA